LSPGPWHCLLLLILHLTYNHWVRNLELYCHTKARTIVFLGLQLVILALLLYFGLFVVQNPKFPSSVAFWAYVAWHRYVVLHYVAHVLPTYQRLIRFSATFLRSSQDKYVFRTPAFIAAFSAFLAVCSTKPQTS
jgi:hypothetical protein